MTILLGHTLPDTVRIVEVGPRDGLQNEKAIIPAAAKVALIRGLAAAGLTDIEATAFVHPKAVPQMADAADVLAALAADPLPFGVRLSALAPNLKGLERAQQAGQEVGLRRIAVFTAASESFTQHNIRMTINESLATFGEVTKAALASGMTVRGYVSTVFYCPYEGKIDREAVLRVTEALFALGCDEVSLGDTIGKAVPTDIEHTVGYLLDRTPEWRPKLALHCHNTYGTALANIVTGLQLGLATIDSSVGGLGGCPYAPGASGNVATEEVVFLLEGLGIATGVDRDRLTQALQSVQPYLQRESCTV